MYDFRQFIQNYWTTAFSLIINGYSADTVVATTRHGYRALQFNFTNPDPNTIYFIYAPLGAEEKAPARLILQRPGFDGVMSEQFGSEGGLGDPTWDTVIAYWLSYILEAKKIILEEWCGASVEGPEHFEIVAGGGLIASSCAYLRVTTDAECMISVESLSGYKIDSDGPLYSNKVFEPPVIVGIGNSTCSFPPGAFDEINKTLQLIALRDYQISFNHGQTIFSALGGVVTG
jgi:hypothetical protein